MILVTEFGYIQTNDTDQLDFTINYLGEKLHQECQLAYEMYKDNATGFLADMHYEEVDSLVTKIMTLKHHKTHH